MVMAHGHVEYKDTFVQNGTASENLLAEDSQQQAAGSTDRYHGEVPCFYSSADASKAEHDVLLPLGRHQQYEHVSITPAVLGYCDYMLPLHQLQDV